MIEAITHLSAIPLPAGGHVIAHLSNHNPARQIVVHSTPWAEEWTDSAPHAHLSVSGPRSTSGSGSTGRTDVSRLGSFCSSAQVPSAPCTNGRVALTGDTTVSQPHRNQTEALWATNLDSGDYFVGQRDQERVTLPGCGRHLQELTGRSPHALDKCNCKSTAAVMVEITLKLQSAHLQSFHHERQRRPEPAKVEAQRGHLSSDTA